MHHTQKLALPITQAVTMRIDAFIQAAGITPVTPRWLLHLTPEQGDLAHTTTTLLLLWDCPASAGEPSWQLLSITDASSWPDMQRPFEELYVDIEQYHYWYCQGGPLNPGTLHRCLCTVANPLSHASPRRTHPSRRRSAGACDSKPPYR